MQSFGNYNSCLGRKSSLLAEPPQAEKWRPFGLADLNCPAVGPQLTTAVGSLLLLLAVVEYNVHAVGLVAIASLMLVAFDNYIHSSS